MASKETLVSGIKGLEARVQGLIQQLTAANGIGSSGTGGTSTNFLTNSLGAFSTTPSVRMMSRMNVGASMVQGGGQVVAGGFAMMPNVAATMERASSYYGATIRAGGGMSREAIQRMTMNGLGEGITSPGSDAMVAAHLTQKGMMASASFGSTYQETVRAVGGAAKYLNMDNSRAAAAVEGMTNRQGAGMMLRNFGIFTSDPTTGKEKTQGQIMGEMYGRMTAGRAKPTEEQVGVSLRRGALGRTLDSMNLTGDQRTMYEQYFRERSKGNNMDLSDPDAMQGLLDKAEADGNKNPNLPGQRLNSSKTNAMQDAEGKYIEGIELATPALQELTEAAGQAASALGGFKSAAALFMGDPVGQGAMGVLSGAGSILGGAALLGAAGKFAPGLLGGAAKSAPPRNANGTFASKTSATANKSGPLLKGKGMGIKGFGLAGAAALGGNLVGSAISGDSEAGSGRSVLGSTISGAATGAGIGAMIGSALAPFTLGASMGVGAAVGGLVGGVAGYFGEGGGSDGQGAGTAGKTRGQNEAFWLQHPTASAKIGARYMATHSVHTGKLVWRDGHKGMDYEGSEGELIRASAPGVAYTENTGELGLRVKIAHSNGKYTFYCHLSATDVTNGQSVNRGAVVGRMGSTGSKSSGVHLHFALSKTDTTGGHENPELYLRGGGNYTDPAPANQEQTASGKTPGSIGETSGRSGESTAEDASTLPTTTSSNILEINKASPKGVSSSGASSASGIESWSEASVYGGAPAGGTPEGGEGYSGEDTNGYLDEPNTSINKRSKSGNGQGRGSSTNNVTINLTISRATEDEARKFTRMLKAGLEDHKLMTNMARN